MTTPPASGRPTPRIVAAPDKFRGTATAPQIARAVADAAHLHGIACTEMPLADGGEGTLDVFGGANRSTTVTGPLGEPVCAGWRLDGDRAVIEMAAAAGLLLAGGAEHNDPLAATTRGVGELIAAAIVAGARHVLVGVGGSATTDGGAGALEVLAPPARPAAAPPGVHLQVCADVRTRFLDAARVFGPQKGADPAQVAALSERLVRQRDDYRDRFGVDVQRLDGSGAAGGLAGGLAAIGADIVDGFGTLAAAAGLDTALRGADLVVTGEGRFDATSLRGKVVGGVIDGARVRSVPVLVVCGSADPDVPPPAGTTVIPLVEAYGRQRAMDEVTACVTDAVSRELRRRHIVAPGGEGQDRGHVE